MTTNKPEVKRYTPAYGVDSVMRGHLFMEECERGAWVSLEDHEALQAECERLRKAAEVSAADANDAERECSKALRTLEGLERVAKVVSDNSDAVCGENNQLRVECESLRKTNSELSSLAYNLTLDLNQLRKDAELYRALRAMHWYSSPLAVVRNPKVAIKPGHDCPSGDRLDEILEEYMSETQNPGET